MRRFTICSGNLRGVQILGLQLAEFRVINGTKLRSLILFLIGHRRLFRVDGDSMLPTLSSGDFVIYRPFKKGQEELSNGSIVIVRHPLKEKTLILKRIHKASSTGIDLRGDNPEMSTDSRQFGIVNHGHLLGVVEELIKTSN